MTIDLEAIRARDAMFAHVPVERLITQSMVDRRALLEHVDELLFTATDQARVTSERLDQWDGVYGRLLARYDALAARLAEAEKFLEPTGWQKAQDEHNALAARLAEAERDAARYRWLRERINWRDQFVPSEDGKGISTRWRAWVHDDYRESPPESEHIDEYIDGQLAADSASGEGEK